MKHIAVVEDEALMREELADMLRRADYAVTEITDFADVTGQLLALAPDLVLLDLNLPEVSGFQICRAVKRRSALPVLVLTSRDQMRDEVHALELGADEYLTKPYRRERLLARIGNDAIDGARGVLFNVTGGYDMSMSEIQEAAEIITSAVSPDANIIFGATLKPEMEDELIITVIATGFDSQYFHDKAAELESAEAAADTSAATETMPVDDDVVAEEAISSIDMDKSAEVSSAESFRAEDEDPTNIWHTAEDDESDTPAFLRRRKKPADDSK